MNRLQTQEKTDESHIHSNKQVSLLTAGIRAVIYQLQALYLRTPVKLFRPTRFDYLAYVRELADKYGGIHAKPYRFHTHSSIGMLVNVMRNEGWRFIPEKVLPPFLANLMTGLILYGTYLTVLDVSSLKRTGESGERITEKSLRYVDFWKAGFIAGAAQSLAAAPVDAIYTRLSMAEILQGGHKNLWLYGGAKLKEIGLIGIFAGYGFSFIKESFGFAFYFLTFELVKSQGYNLTYKMIVGVKNIKRLISLKFSSEPEVKLDEIEQRRLTKILKTSFVLLAGASAALSLFLVQYPLTKIQKIHLSRLETLDIYNSAHKVGRPFIKLYYNSYIDTYFQVVKLKTKSKGTWLQAGYKGFVKNALATVPATSIGLLVFEIMRTRLDQGEEIREGIVLESA